MLLHGDMSFGYDFRDNDICFSGVSHDGMAGAGYSMHPTVNVLSLSPANIAYTDDERLIGYDIALLFDKPDYYSLGQEVNIVQSFNSVKLGAWGIQINNISSYSPIFQETDWNDSLQQIIEDGDGYRFKEKETSITFGYGILLPPQEKQVHALGASLSYNWINNKCNEVFSNRFIFNFDIAYSLLLAEMLKFGILIKDISIGKIINVEGDNFSRSRFSAIYSIGVDTKGKKDNIDKKLNFALETYLNRITNWLDGENKYVETYWGIGSEFLILNKLALRTGFLLHNDYNKQYSIPFGIGINLNNNMGLDISCKRVLDKIEFPKTDVNFIQTSNTVIERHKWQLGVSFKYYGMKRSKNN